MSNPTRWAIERWMADYGDGEPEAVTVPHAWRQELSVASEGPVVYSTKVSVPKSSCHLLFHGVSYLAEVSVDGVQIARHEGIWDAFAVPLTPYAGREVELSVRVVKNGGPTYPVCDVASGFLPFVYHTFGGIYSAVEIVVGSEPVLDSPAPPTRVEVEESKIFVDGMPFYPRGLLHWGWYPELGHTNVSEDAIRREVSEAKRLGFNLIKFCLWVPPHRYLEVLKEEGMEAWMELPLWDPTPEREKQEAIGRELERIVRQYRHHDNILVWTVGCELSGNTSPEFREYLYGLVRNLTGCPLVKDNSGGAEMYGGDLREFGDFYDFHPYCDTQFYPAVLDTLLPSGRTKNPVLLGEFNDIDVHRDLAQINYDHPYWSSSTTELNAQGVRWQYDLPGIMAGHNRFADQPQDNGHKALMESTRRKALFVRKTVHEAVRMRDAIGGYVVTGLRDTPVSSSGFFDDWGRARFSPAECLSWNGPSVLFLIPSRRPPWVNGGNRPGFDYPLVQFTGSIHWRVGIHTERGQAAGLTWKVVDASGHVAARGAASLEDAPALESTEVGQIHWDCQVPGAYELLVEFGAVRNQWPIWVVDRPDISAHTGWQMVDDADLLGGLSLPGGANTVRTGLLPDWRQTLESGANALAFLTHFGTKPMPFWREAGYEFRNTAFWDGVPFAEEWERLLPVSTDRAIDSEWLQAQIADGYSVEVLMNRIDTRTYVESAVLARITREGLGTLLVTTLRPFGGLGTQPTSLDRNPAGLVLLDSLLRSFPNR